MNLPIPLGTSPSPSGAAAGPNSRSHPSAADAEPPQLGTAKQSRLPAALAELTVDARTRAAGARLTGNSGGGSQLEGPPKLLQRSLNAGMQQK